MCTFTTLQDMKHSAQIYFGDSDSSYGGEKWALHIQPPLQLLVQGYGEKPGIWSIVSTPLLNCLRDTGHVTVFKCCFSGNTLKQVIYLFVYN